MTNQIGQKKQYSPLVNSKPVSGKYLNSVCASVSGTTAIATANNIMFFTLWLGKSASINKLVVRTANVASTDKITLGIYAEDENGRIGKLLANSAEINGTPTGYVFLEAEIPITHLPAGKYWMAFLTNGTTARFFGAIQANATYVWSDISMLQLGKNGYPSIPQSYTNTLPSDLSSVDLETVNVVSSSPIVLAKFV